MIEYIELHCHSNFSLLDAASPPEDLVLRAAELGMPALALTDHDNLYGAARFSKAAQAAGIQPIFGAELTLADQSHLTLLVENEVGWHNLCWLITQARHHAPKGQAALPPAVLTHHTEGLIGLSGCHQGEIAAALLRRDREAALAAAQRYRHLFGPDRFWLELHHHLRPGDGELVRDLVALARHLGLGYVASNNVHYATRLGCRLQDILVCIGHQIRLDEAGPLLRPNSEFYLKSAQQLTPLFAAYPEALSNTRRIADRCHFTLQYGLQDLPPFPTPGNLPAEVYLRQLCQAAFAQRYPHSTLHAARQLDHELAIIGYVGLANYFLIVWDIVRFARERRIRCQGRGSAANSLVAYLLGISPIDPLAHHLVFERFLSPERAIVPDIDLDFEATDHREEVIQYVYQRYGVDHAAMACTFVTFQKRSALRDIAKVLGLSEAIVSRAADQLSGLEPARESQTQEDLLVLLLDLCHQIQDYPRHLSVHNGGMVVTGLPLATRVPTEPATMVNRTVVQWDKESLEAVGLVKIDLLGLRMLSAIADTVNLIEETTGLAPDLDQLSFTDPEVFRLIASADTIGIFQVESRAQTQMLPKLQPRCFNDLIIAVSIIRPGPIQGNMVRPFMARRLGLEPVTYLHPLLKDALAETLGVIIFQEQVLKVARDLAGFSAGQGEQLRRALGSKRGLAEMERFHQAFIAGAQARGVPSEVAERVFDQLRAFGSYSFAKSHAASFAVLVYQSAWLKRYHPLPYYVSLLNHQPLGFWQPSVLVMDAKRHGIAILPIDIERSQGLCTVEGPGLRLGFNYVVGFGEASITRLISTRQAGAFTNLADLCRRTQLSRRLIERLILVGALDRWGIPRRRLLWDLGPLPYQEAELDLGYATETVDLPPLSKTEAFMTEYELLGLSTGDHVLALYRPWLEQQGILGSWELKTQPVGKRIHVAGLVVVHQSPPTAKHFHFVTIEDEGGLLDVIIQPQIVTQIKKLPSWYAFGLNDQTLLLVEGIVQRDGNVINVLATRIQPLIPNTSHV